MAASFLSQLLGSRERGAGSRGRKMASDFFPVFCVSLVPLVSLVLIPIVNLNMKQLVSQGEVTKERRRLKGQR